MANPDLYYFDPPEKLTFKQNEFRADKDSAACFMFWFPPGTRVLVQAWVPPSINDRAPSINALDNWDAKGNGRSIKGIEGRVMNMNETLPPVYPYPWSPTVGQRGKWSWVQLAIPKQDSTGGAYPTNLNGIWKEGDPHDAFSAADDPEEYDQSSPQVLLRSSHGQHTWNMFSSIKAIEARAYRHERPQLLVFNEIREGTDCIDILDVPHAEDGFLTIRTTVLQVTADNVTYRSTPPQIVRGGGFVAFGYV